MRCLQHTTGLDPLTPSKQHHLWVYLANAKKIRKTYYPWCSVLYGFNPCLWRGSPLPYSKIMVKELSVTFYCQDIHRRWRRREGDRDRDDRVREREREREAKSRLDVCYYFRNVNISFFSFFTVRLVILFLLKFFSIYFY